MAPSTPFKPPSIPTSLASSSLLPSPPWFQTLIGPPAMYSTSPPEPISTHCKSRKKWYPVTKTLTERAAWEFAEKKGIDLVAIHPATCLGPPLQPGLNASFALFTEETQPGLVVFYGAAKELVNLGLKFAPVEDAVRETVESLRARGLVAEPPQA
ncbi:unnamed protein product [Linum tenue]|uniref:Uncharacterized protein n=1 Tax=Linum tenue TaxID=586396 RepID=A0AAV0GWX7_9ROSI|nr:unnamed protein product [Linum tenue]